MSSECVTTKAVAILQFLPPPGRLLMHETRLIDKYTYIPRGLCRVRRSRSTVWAVNSVISPGPRHTPSEPASKCPANEESGLAATFITRCVFTPRERNREEVWLKKHSNTSRESENYINCGKTVLFWTHALVSTEG